MKEEWTISLCEYTDNKGIKHINCKETYRNHVSNCGCSAVSILSTECYHCNKSIPNYILFQYRLLIDGK